MGSLNPALILFLVAILYLSFQKVGANPLLFKKKSWTFLFAACFGLILATSSRIHLEAVSANYTKTTISSFGIFQICIFIAAIVYFSYVLQYFQQLLPKINAFVLSKGNETYSLKKYFLFFVFILLLCWSPYALGLYPGVVLPDSLSSVAQAMGDTPINNHHPVLFTLIVKFFIHDLPVKSINHGVFLFSIFQMIVLASTISYSLCWLMKKRVQRLPILLSLGYFSLAPVFPIYALNMQKDILFAAACLLFSLAVSDAVFTEKRVSVWHQIVIVVLALLTTYLRNNGLYVVIGISILCFFASLKTKKFRPAIQMILGYGLIAGLLIHPLMVKYAVPTASAEQLGIPLQQVARTIVTNGEISKNDLSFMNDILPLEDYQSYAPGLSDPIKWHQNFDNEFLDTHQKEFLFLWARNLPANLSTYTDAYALNTFGFWVPGVKNSYGFLDTRVNDNNYGIKQIDLLEHFTGLSGMKKIIDQRDFFGSGTLLWLVLLSVFAILVKKRYRLLILLLPGILVVLTILIATPVAFSLRYVFILALGLPIYLATPFLAEEKQGIEREQLGGLHETTKKD
ncbi:hypothetical protein D920_00828 [Enterococcus faecalis 13-SD-W-01]|nr:hypothetical protein D920_00828 [Enterococcus faecalis 13-SD-W-01]